MDTLEEVIEYDRLSLQYLKILHHGFIETILNASPEEGNFLEVGIGTGRISIGVASFIKNVMITGVDMSQNMLNVAKMNARKENVRQKLTLLKADAKNLPFPPESFDSVYCHNMLHHITNPLHVIHEMKRVAKKDGAILIRDLVRHHPVVTWIHVHVFGFRYNRMMKKEYRDSIKAALSKKEWVDLFCEAQIPNAKLTYQFLTHQGIERPSEKKRPDPVKVETPFHLRMAKAMYVTKR